MTTQINFDSWSKKPDVVRSVIARQYKGCFRSANLIRNTLHLSITKALGIWYDTRGIATVTLLRESVNYINFCHGITIAKLKFRVINMIVFEVLINWVYRQKR